MCSMGSICSHCTGGSTHMFYGWYMFPLYWWKYTCILWVVYVLTVLVQVHVCSMGGICPHCIGGSTRSMGGICSHCTG